MNGIGKITLLQLQVHSRGLYITIKMNMQNEHAHINREQTFHIPSEPKNQQLDIKRCNNLCKRCWNIYERIINKKKRQFYGLLGRLCNQFYDGQKQKQIWQKNQRLIIHEQESEPMINEQDQRRSVVKRLIIPIIVSKNQVQYIQEFINYFIQRLKISAGNKNDNRQAIVKNNTINQIKKPILFEARYINLFGKSGCKQIEKIALYMHQNLSKHHLKQDFSFYISKQVTDLSPSNLSILEKRLSDFNYAIIVPTDQSFQQIIYENFPTSQIMPVKLFQHRDLFAQLMFETICDPQIMAYLPKESLRLFDNFHGFSISFKEGTRRLTYFIQKLEMLRQRRHVKFHHVDIKTMFKTIQQSIKYQSLILGSTEPIIQKYIGCILNEKYEFNILESYFSSNFYLMKKQIKTEIQLIKQLRETLTKNLDKNESFRQYLTSFKEKQVETFKIKQGLKESQQDYLYTKDALELNIKDFIYNCTQNIRQQAANFDWADYQQIEAMISQNISNSAMMSKGHKQLIQFIYQCKVVPMSSIFDEFCKLRKWDYGKLIYYINDLQLCKLIDFSGKIGNLIVQVSLF